jgi:murein DD-endopeptidase MepM/ murein hydrolase activator NlpD
MKKIIFTLVFIFLNTNYSQAENEIEEINVSDKPAISYKITPKINVYSDNVFQGQQIVIDVNEDNLDSYYLEFNKKKYKVLEKRNFIPVHPETKVGNYSVKLLESDNIIAEYIIKVKYNSFSSQYINYYKPKLPKEQEDLIQKEDSLVENAKLVLSDKKLWSEPFSLPVPHKVNGVYGIKRYLNGKYNGYHGGVDFASPYGYPVKAINNATVTLAKYFSKYNSNGNIVFLDHGIGVGSVYLHLSKISVKEGQYIKKGQIIGYIGSSGRSTGPHLHWGVYLYGQNTDGLSWIKLTKKIY